MNLWKIYQPSIVFNARRQLVSDINRYLVTYMPQRKYFVLTGIQDAAKLEVLSFCFSYFDQR
jgi:hypothetical protein